MKNENCSCPCHDDPDMPIYTHCEDCFDYWTERNRLNIEKELQTQLNDKQEVKNGNG